MFIKIVMERNASCADSSNHTLLEVFKKRFVLTQTVIIKEASQEKELTLQK